jgi:hypothetical protein
LTAEALAKAVAKVGFACFAVKKDFSTALWDGGNHHIKVIYFEAPAIFADEGFWS